VICLRRAASAFSAVNLLGSVTTLMCGKCGMSNSRERHGRLRITPSSHRRLFRERSSRFIKAITSNKEHKPATKKRWKYRTNIKAANEEARIRNQLARQKNSS